MTDPHRSIGDDRPFSYGDYSHAKDALLDALRGPRGYALVVGTSGMGKTCLVHDVSAQLDRRRHSLVYIAAPRASIVGIVRLLARRLHLRSRPSHLETVVTVTETIAAQTMHWVLWLDDGDQIATTTLAQLRTLVEAVPAATPLLSVVLSGPAALHARLQTPELFALYRRIALVCTLAGLRKNELDAFLEHRFGASVAQRVPLSIKDELFERTQAAPALLDRVVRHTIVRRPQGVIDEDEVRAVLDSVGL